MYTVIYYPYAWVEITIIIKKGTFVSLALISNMHGPFTWVGYSVAE